MKEMLQSKVLLSFIIFVLGFTYLNTFSEDISSLETDITMDVEVVMAP